LDLVCVLIQTVDRESVVRAKRGGQAAVATSQMNDQAALGSAGRQDLRGRLPSRRIEFGTRCEPPRAHAEAGRDRNDSQHGPRIATHAG
jgi:hypothetical protein